MRRKQNRIVIALFWLALWQGAGMALRQPLILPLPLSVLRRLGELIFTHSFWLSIGISSGRIMSGFLLGCLTGILLAIPAGLYRRIRDFLYPAAVAVKAVPVASFVILALMWLNSRHLSVFIAFLMAFPPIYTGVLEGMAQADPQLLEMADLFRIPFRRRFTGIYLPRILPSFRTAASVAMGLCWKAGTAAELIGLPKYSLGERLYNAKIYFLTADLFAWTIVIVALSAVCERLFLKLLDLFAERMGLV